MTDADRAEDQKNTAHKIASQMDESDRRYGREKMDAGDVDATLFEIRAAIEAARRGEIGDGGLQDAAADVEAVRGWVNMRGRVDDE